MKLEEYLRSDRLALFLLATLPSRSAAAHLDDIRDELMNCDHLYATESECRERIRELRHHGLQVVCTEKHRRTYWIWSELEQKLVAKLWEASRARC